MTEKMWGRCRSCLKFSPQVYSVDTHLLPVKDLFSRLVPEVSLSASPNPVICISCYQLLEIVHKFRTQCLRTENLIHMYSSKQTTGVGYGNLKLQDVFYYWKSVYYSNPYRSELPRAYLSDVFDEGELNVPDVDEPSEVQVRKISTPISVETTSLNSPVENNSEEPPGSTYFVSEKSAVAKARIRVRSDATLFGASTSPPAIENTEYCDKIYEGPLVNEPPEAAEIQKEPFGSKQTNSREVCFKKPEIPPTKKRRLKLKSTDKVPQSNDGSLVSLRGMENEALLRRNEFDQSPILSRILSNIPTTSACLTSSMEQEVQDLVAQFAPTTTETSTETSKDPVEEKPRKRRWRRKKAHQEQKEVDRNLYCMPLPECTGKGDYVNDHDYLEGPYEINNMRIKRSNGYACRCLLCDSTQATDTHSGHIRKHTTQCLICKEIFDNVFLLNLHARGHFHDCLYCDEPLTYFQYLPHFENHLRNMEKIINSPVIENQQETELGTNIDQFGFDEMEFISLADLSSSSTDTGSEQEFDSESPLINYVHSNEPQASLPIASKPPITQINVLEKTDECQRNKTVILSKDKAGMYNHRESSTATENIDEIRLIINEEVIEIEESDVEEEISPKQVTGKKSESANKSAKSLNIELRNEEPQKVTKSPVKERNLKSFFEGMANNAVEMAANILATNTPKHKSDSLNNIEEENNQESNIITLYEPEDETITESIVITSSDEDEVEELSGRQMSPIFVADSNELSQSKLDDIDPEADATELLDDSLEEFIKNSIEYDPPLQNISKPDATENIRSKSDDCQKDVFVEVVPDELEPSNQLGENPEREVEKSQSQRFANSVTTPNSPSGSNIVEKGQVESNRHSEIENFSISNLNPDKSSDESEPPSSDDLQEEPDDDKRYTPSTVAKFIKALQEVSDYLQKESQKLSVDCEKSDFESSFVEFMENSSDEVCENYIKFTKNRSSSEPQPKVRQSVFDYFQKESQKPLVECEESDFESFVEFMGDSSDEVCENYIKLTKNSEPQPSSSATPQKETTPVEKSTGKRVPKLTAKFLDHLKRPRKSHRIRRKLAKFSSNPPYSKTQRLEKPQRKRGRPKLTTSSKPKPVGNSFVSVTDLNKALQSVVDDSSTSDYLQKDNEEPSVGLDFKNSSVNILDETLPYSSMVENSSMIALPSSSANAQQDTTVQKSTSKRVSKLVTHKYKFSDKTKRLETSKRKRGRPKLTTSSKPVRKRFVSVTALNKALESVFDDDNDLQKDLAEPSVDRCDSTSRFNLIEALPSSSTELQETTTAEKSTSKRVSKLTHKYKLKKFSDKTKRLEKPRRKRGRPKLTTRSKPVGKRFVFVTDLNEALQSVFQDEPSLDYFRKDIEEPPVDGRDSKSSSAEEPLPNSCKVEIENNSIEELPSTSANAQQDTKVEKSTKKRMSKLTHKYKLKKFPDNANRIEKPKKRRGRPKLNTRSKPVGKRFVSWTDFNKALESVFDDQPTSDYFQKDIEEPPVDGCDSNSSSVNVSNVSPEETLPNSSKLEIENNAIEPLPSSSANAEQETKVEKSTKKRVSKLTHKYKLNKFSDKTKRLEKPQRKRGRPKLSTSSKSKPVGNSFVSVTDLNEALPSVFDDQPTSDYFRKDIEEPPVDGCDSNSSSVNVSNVSPEETLPNSSKLEIENNSIEPLPSSSANAQQETKVQKSTKKRVSKFTHKYKFKKFSDKIKRLEKPHRKRGRPKLTTSSKAAETRNYSGEKRSVSVADLNKALESVLDDEPTSDYFRKDIEEPPVDGCDSKSSSIDIMNESLEEAIQKDEPLPITSSAIPQQETTVEKPINKRVRELKHKHKLKKLPDIAKRLENKPQKKRGRPKLTTSSPSKVNNLQEESVQARICFSCERKSPVSVEDLNKALQSVFDDDNYLQKDLVEPSVDRCDSTSSFNSIEALPSSSTEDQKKTTAGKRVRKLTYKCSLISQKQTSAKKLPKRLRKLPKKYTPESSPIPDTNPHKNEELNLSIENQMKEKGLKQSRNIAEKKFKVLSGKIAKRNKKSMVKAKLLRASKEIETALIKMKGKQTLKSGKIVQTEKPQRGRKRKRVSEEDALILKKKKFIQTTKTTAKNRIEETNSSTSSDNSNLVEGKRVDATEKTRKSSRTPKKPKKLD